MTLNPLSAFCTSFRLERMTDVRRLKRTISWMSTLFIDSSYSTGNL